MLKVTIKGEVFSFDETAYPMDEAIALEETLEWSYGKYQEQLMLGSAKAVAAMAWCVLRRNGRDVPMSVLMSGEYTTADITAEREGDEEAVPSGPTSPGASSGEITGDGSDDSPKPSDTRQQKSARSRSTSSTI